MTRNLAAEPSEMDTLSLYFIFIFFILFIFIFLFLSHAVPFCLLETLHIHCVVFLFLFFCPLVPRSPTPQLLLCLSLKAVQVDLAPSIGGKCERDAANMNGCLVLHTLTNTAKRSPQGESVHA